MTHRKPRTKRHVTDPRLTYCRRSEAQSALGALLDPLLAGAGITFGQWLMLTVTAASGIGQAAYQRGKGHP